MIPQAYIIEWHKNAPWSQPSQVEQDLVICRALVEVKIIRLLKLPRQTFLRYQKLLVAVSLTLCVSVKYPLHFVYRQWF